MTRRKKEPQASNEKATPLTGGRLALAYELAKHGIARCLPDPQIVLSIVEQCSTTPRSASAALQKIARQGAKLDDGDREALREKLHFRYEYLYAAEAQAGRSEAAAKMLDRRARLDGLFIAKPAEVAPKEAPADAEFDGRTQEELEFYGAKGFWPEEQPAANVVALDPMARLKKKQA